MKLSYKTVAIVLAGLGLLAATLQPAFASTLTLTAEADSFVLADSPSTNRGSSTVLRINDDVKRAYLRFNTSRVSPRESQSPVPL